MKHEGRQMKNTACAIALVAAVLSATAAWAAPQWPPVEEVSPPPAQPVGTSLLAAFINIFYFPARFVVTVGTAELGGLAGWLNGGDEGTAQAVWNSTEGQAYVTPAILEGREPLRFGQ